MKILKYPNPILLQKSEPIVEITKELEHLANKMIKTMKNLNGKGLAAPQVGHNIRLFVMNYEGKPMAFFNPLINNHGRDIINSNEGCLSIPNQKFDVERYRIINIIFTDICGKQHSIKMRNFNAYCVQHEIDHLDGILINGRNDK